MKIWKRIFYLRLASVQSIFFFVNKYNWFEAGIRYSSTLWQHITYKLIHCTILLALVYVCGEFQAQSFKDNLHPLQHNTHSFISEWQIIHMKSEAFIKRINTLKEIIIVTVFKYFVTFCFGKKFQMKFV